MYRNISDYGLVGDMRSAALVSREGSIDYCSLPHFDSPTLFAALLDERNGGFFSLNPAETFSSERKYLPDTCILRTSFTTRNGKASLYDFMPLQDDEARERPQGIHRCIRVDEGRVEFTLTLAPRPGYGLERCVIAEQNGAFTINPADPPLTLLHTLGDVRAEGVGGDTLTLAFTLQADENAHFDLLCGQVDPEAELPCPFRSTRSWWEEWVRTCIGDHCAWLGRFTPLAHRSLLTLKLLTFQPTGAIVAAATTSLPESIGGERNWDYRFTWIRDASFTLKAFFALGHTSEAESFIRWLHDTYRNNGSRDLMIMYSIHGDEALQEKHLDHFDGYRHSRPVRIGNAARSQQQWDIYGEIMDAALRLSEYAGQIDASLWPFFRDICQMAIESWKRPDDGIWEVRNGPYHFVYSKVMCWVALDRGIALARRFGFEAPLERWEREREAIKSEVLARGFSQRLNAFVQRFDTDILDASLLILPLVGFLPVTDSRIEGTIEACRNHLMAEGFVSRYHADDGLEGDEGGFLLCNFWMIECLALSGKIAEAEELLGTTMQAANDLGLFSEEYDPRSRQMLGNFPQAFSHIGYINAAAVLSGSQRPGANP